ncbi:MAG: MFS transporter [Fastidiosipilaceae bacterium]|jgi:MFS family permease
MQETQTKGSNPLRSNYQMIVSFIIVALFWFSTYVYLPYQTAFLTDLQTGSFMIGLITGSYGFAQILLRPPLGVMIDLQGKQKPYILIGVFMPAVASAVRLLALNATGFLIGNILSGVGAAMWIVFLVYFTRFFNESNMQKSSTIMMAANQMGQLIGFVLSALVYSKVGMATLCWFSVGAALIATVLSFTLEENGNEQRNDLMKNNQGGATQGKVQLSDLWVVFKNKRLLFYSIFAIGQTGLVLATATSFNTKIILDMGGGDLEVGISMLVFMFFAVLCAFLAAVKVIRNLGPKIMIPFSLLCVAVFCFLTPYATTIKQIYLLQILAGIYAGFIVSFAIGEATVEIPTSKRTTAMGVFQFFVAVGISGIPLITGKLVEAYSLTLAYTVLGFFSTALFLLSIWCTRTKKLDANPRQIEELNRISG